MTANRDLSVLPGLLGAKAVMLQFLKVELDIAATFVESAKAASSREHRLWKYGQAKKAHDTIARMMNRVELSTAEADFLSNRLAALKIALQQVAELC